MKLIYNMSSGIDGTIIYSNANIEGTVAVDQSQAIADIQQRITDITYDAGTDTTNIDNNVNITGTTNLQSNLQLQSNLLIYDKSTPTAYPYRFSTTGSTLFFAYDGPTSRALFDVSLNTVSGFPELNMRRIWNLYNNFQLQNNLEFRLGTIGGSTYAFMKYTESTRQLSLVAGQGGGLVDSTFIITTNTASGSPFVLAFNPTQLTVPKNIEVIGNYTSTSGNFTLTNGRLRIQQATDIPSLSMYAGGSVAFGNRVADYVSQIGGLRTFNVIGDQGVLRVARYSDTGQASLELMNLHPTTGVLRNTVLLNGGAPSREQFSILMRTPTDLNVFLITRTFSEMYVPFSLLSNNFSQTLTGIISQSGSGVNLMKAITMQVDNNFLQSGTGIISQSGSGVNLLKATTLNVNTDLNLSGTGKIVQSAGASINLLNQSTFSGTVDTNIYSLTQSTGSIIQSSNTGGNQLKNSTFIGQVNTTTNNITQTTGIISQSTAGGTNQLVATTFIGAVGTTTNNITQTSGRITQTGSTANTLGGITMNSSSVLTFQDSTVQRSKFTEDILNDCELHSLESGRTILGATYSVLTTASTYTSIASGFHYYTPIQVISGVSYTGIGISTGTAGTYEVGLYNSGLTPARLAGSLPTATNANVMTYINFIGGAWTNTGATRIVYIVYRTTTSSPAQTILYSGALNFINFGFNTMTNSTLNKRGQYATIAGSFADPLPAGITMTAQGSMLYAVLY